MASKTKQRTAEIKRKTKETEIVLTLTVDGTGKAQVDTGIGLLNHMLELFSFHGLFDLDIKAKGDIQQIDLHHTNEDVGIVLGKAFKEALGDKEGIRRFGSASAPMEEVVADVTVDISGRSFFKLHIDVPRAPKPIEGYQFAYVEHFLESFAKNSGMNLVVKLNNTVDDLHTNLEPIFKALGIALDQATQIDPRRKGVPSTKGVID
ncbi:imidazoleglycerol-phosphate dehydratase HisB [Candidatus Omnitrophota bacterium]